MDTAKIQFLKSLREQKWNLLLYIKGSPKKINLQSILYPYDSFIFEGLNGNSIVSLLCVHVCGM